MTRLASAIGDTSAALEWGEAGVNAVRAANRGFLLIGLAQHLVPNLILRDRYSDALQLALDATRLGIAAFTKEPEGIATSMIGAEIDAGPILADAPSETLKAIDRHSALQVLLGAAWRLESIARDDRHEAHKRALVVAGLCRARAAAAFYPDLWIAAASLFEQAFSFQASATSIIGWANRLDSGLQALRPVAYAMASVMNLPIEDALRAQASALDAAEKGSMPIADLVGWPLLDRFWTETRDDRLYLISVQSAMQGARRAPLSMRSRQLLEAVGEALGVRLPWQAALGVAR